MTMQTAANGSYQPRKTGGNYHRVHEELLRYADKDGVFQTTEAQKHLMKKLGLGKTNVSSSSFQWSDPTDRRGFRRVRLYKPRVTAADPVEMQDDKGAKPKPEWAERAFGGIAKPNKNGPLYRRPGRGTGVTGDMSRRQEYLDTIWDLQPRLANPDGFWPLRDMANRCASLGLHPQTVYKMVQREVAAGRCEKDGWNRRFTKREQVRVDPLSDPNSFKGPKTQERVDQERDINTEAVNDRPPAKAEGIPTGIDGVVAQLVRRKLEHPDTQAVIDAFVKARVEEALRRQLGVL